MFRPIAFSEIVAKLEEYVRIQWNLFSWTDGKGALVGTVHATTFKIVIQDNGYLHYTTNHAYEPAVYTDIEDIGKAIRAHLVSVYEDYEKALC